MKCRLIIDGPYFGGYFWVFHSIEHAPTISIESSHRYKRPGTARLAAKRWAARHNIQIVEETRTHFPGEEG